MLTFEVGTVNPILPVISELVKRGCDVRYYLMKDAVFFFFSSVVLLSCFVVGCLFFL